MARRGGRREEREEKTHHTILDHTPRLKQEIKHPKNIIVKIHFEFWTVFLEILQVVLTKKRLVFFFKK